MRCRKRKIRRDGEDGKTGAENEKKINKED
jgi:hypothetical protein